MPLNGNDTPDTPDAGAAQEFAGVIETITVPDRNLSGSEMAVIMRQVARVCNFVTSMIMREASLSEERGAAGAGHPICQAILSCAAQADAAAVNLAGPPAIMKVAPTPQLIRGR